MKHGRCLKTKPTAEADCRQFKIQFMVQRKQYNANYYKGLVSSDLQQRYTRDADQNSDADMLARNINFGLWTAGVLAALLVAFMFSNGLL